MWIILIVYHTLDVLIINRYNTFVYKGDYFVLVENILRHNLKFKINKDNFKKCKSKHNDAYICILWF